MKISKLLLAIYFCLGILFVVGATLEIRSLLVTSNFFLVPFLVLYYRFSSRKIFYPIVIVLLTLYLRDIFLIYGFDRNPLLILMPFLIAVVFLLCCLITEFKKSRLHIVEILSFLIMYGFLGYLFISLSEIVPQKLPTRQWSTYLYLFLLMLLMAGSFTHYIIKSHVASLYFMVATGFFLISEVSLFFKLFILEDLSLNFFYPFFHVLAYYGYVEFARKRRRTGKLRIF